MATTLLRERRTKLVATLGPATTTAEGFAGLLDAGVDVVRLNLSHGDHDDHARAYELVRTAAAARGRHVAVLADLGGPKIRVGRFPDGPVTLTDGATVTLTVRDIPGTSQEIPSAYAGLARDVQVGMRILLADGMLELRAERVTDTDVICTVVHGGELSDRKGINLPDSVVSTPALTDKDRVDAAFAAELGVDWIALSFVQAASDIRELRDLLQDAGSPAIVAKIERPNAVAAAEEIVAAADGIMVARGDLGVELPPEEVPVVQRQLIAMARRHAKPVIVATQMLETMVVNPQPTRAEVSDVSTAVFAGADAVMLSAETAVGAHPEKAMAMLDRIARRIEAHQWDAYTFRIDEPVSEELPLAEAVARSTAQLSRDLRVRAIVVHTSSGRTAAVMSAARPAAPVLCLTADERLARRLALLWGIIPVLVSDEQSADPDGLGRHLPVDRGLAQVGQSVLLVSGFGDTDRSAEPVLKVLRAAAHG
ncbi:MAG TPA: pyruvate kinase [Euzebya sp.]|nr:pyruvate kinase [Euzebya sp.]